MATITNHNFSLHSFTLLPAFAQYLLQHKLDAFVHRQLEIAREIDVPMLRQLNGYSEEEIELVMKNSATLLLSHLAQNDGAAYIANSISNWEQDKLPFIGKEAIQTDDIALLIFSRKKAFLSFIPEYNQDINQIIKLLEEIDLFMMQTHTAAINTFTRLLHARIDEHVHFIEKITNTSPGIIYVYDVVQQKEVYTNKTVTDIIGYTADEIKEMGSGFVNTLIHPDDLQTIRTYEQEFTNIIDGEIRSVRYRMKNKDGNYKWMRAYESVFKRDEAGGVGQKIGIAIDVSAMVETAQQLRENEALYKQAEAISHIGSWSWNIADNRITWSDEMYRIFGLPENTEVDFEQYQSLLHPLDKPEILEKIQQSLVTHEPYTFTHRIIFPDGSLKHLLANGTIVLNNEGKPLKIVGTTQDVTERQLLVERLQRSETLYKQAQALSHLGNWSYQIKTKQFIWSDEMYHIYDLPVGERIDEIKWQSYIHPDDRDEVVAYSENMMNSKERYDKMYRIILKSGTVKTIHRKGEFIFDANGNVTEMIGTTQDVSEQQKTQHELRENQLFLNKITNATPSIITAYNIHTGQYSFISEGLQKLLGYEIPELKDNGVAFLSKIVHPDDLPAVLEKRRDTVTDANKNNADHTEVKEYTYRMRHKNGNYRWMHTYETVFDRNPRGEVESMLNITLDNTEQVEANKTIEQQELFIQQIADASPTILYIFDIASNSIEYVNKEIYFVLGYSTDEVEAMGADVVTKLYHPEDIALLPERQESDKKFQHLNSMIQYECRVKSKDGDWKWLLVREVIFKNEAGDKPVKILGAALDITKRKDMERSLLQNSFQLEQSNASLEEFAYVASHDLKEPLRKISTFGDRLVATHSEKLTGDGQIYLKKIIDASQRMQLMINDLLSISMISGNRSYELYSLQNILEDAKGALEYKLEQKAAIIEANSLPEAHIVVSQFRQLFQNLLSNSLKFTKEGVQPVIKITATYLLPQDLKTYQLNPAGRYLQLRFSDNGIGFEEEYAGKIFQIFQRLHGRSEYEGTGIGLAICKKIVEHHGGVIFANGKPGEGATFTIILPS